MRPGLAGARAPSTGPNESGDLPGDRSRGRTYGCTMSDTDKDGLSDFMERWHGSDPDDADTDRDGMNDGDEVDLGWDPTKSEPQRVRDRRADMDRKWEDLDRSYEEARD